MKDAQKPDHVSLNTLINRLREGQYVVPDFQRDFEWEPWDIRELMRSLFLDYYIGSLLLWRGTKEHFHSLSCEPIYGFSGRDVRTYIVLDGQQRLTAMYYAFFAPNVRLPNRASSAIYFVRVDRLMAEEHDRAFSYDWISKRWSERLRKPELQYAEHIFPLSVIGSGGWALPTWCQGYRDFWQKRADAARAAGKQDEATQAEQYVRDAEEFGSYIKDLTEQYQISYIELDKDLEVDKVCDIFTQINSRGVRLDVFDLMNALLKPKGLKLKHLWKSVESRLEFVGTGKMNVYILQIMSILRQGYCSPKYLYFLLPGQEKPIRDPDGTRRKEVLVADINAFRESWERAVASMESAIAVLRHPQEFGAITSGFLPYVSILPVFAALRAQVASLPPNRQLAAQRKVRFWYWASVFLSRYSGSVESTSARDFLDLRTWLDNDDQEPAPITEFRARFRSIDLRGETKRGTSVYNGIFNLLVLKGARDWMTGGVPQHGDLDDHHIVPASWGAENVPEGSIHSILNRTPLTANTNRRVIRDRLPNVYLPELIKEAGEDQVQAVMDSHFISPTALQILLRPTFAKSDFEEFIAERQRTIQEAIEDLLIKERLDLPPQLRDLDAAVEAIELKLRALLRDSAADNWSVFPGHITQKVEERVSRAIKKNAALSSDRFQTLEGRLEFFDLRELEVAFNASNLWSKVSQVFGSKEALAKRFDQLAELRNGIRHSRTVSDVTRKDGEAAILWFRQVLANTETSAILKT